MELTTIIKSTDTWSFKSTAYFNRVDVNGLSGDDGEIYLNGQNIIDIIAVSAGGSTGSDVALLSGNWESTYTTVNVNSGLWSDAYTNLITNSATYLLSGDTVNLGDIPTLSGNWNSVYTTTNSNSGDWNYQGTDIKTLSSNWETTFTTVQANSSNWSEAYTNLVNNSAVYLLSGTDINLSDIPILSGNWNSTYDTVYALSGNWSEVYTTVQINSANWSEAFTNLVSNSAAYLSSVDISLLASASANWNSTFETVCALSSNWDDAYTTVQANSANWQIDAIQVACSDLTTNLAIGNSIAYFRMPYTFIISDVRASVLEAPVGATLLTVDINKSNGSILSRKLTFDSGELTTTTATTAYILSTTNIFNDEPITIDIDAVGSVTPGKGLIVTLLGYKV